MRVGWDTYLESGLLTRWHASRERVLADAGKETGMASRDADCDLAQAVLSAIDHVGGLGTGSVLLIASCLWTQRSVIVSAVFDST